MSAMAILVERVNSMHVELSAIKAPGQWSVTPSFLGQEKRISKMSKHFSVNPLHFLGHDTPTGPSLQLSGETPSPEQIPRSWYEKVVPSQHAFIPLYRNFIFDGPTTPPISDQYQPYSTAIVTQGITPNTATSEQTKTAPSKQRMYAEETVWIQDRSPDGILCPMVPCKIYKGEILHGALQTTSTTAPAVESTVLELPNHYLQLVAVINPLAGATRNRNQAARVPLMHQGPPPNGIHNQPQEPIVNHAATYVSNNPAEEAESLKGRGRQWFNPPNQPMVNQAQYFGFDEEEDFVDINAAEIINMKGYKCTTLRKPSTPQACDIPLGQGTATGAKPRADPYNPGRVYSFDITQQEAIFEDMLKIGHVTYRKGQRQSKPADIERKTYCKYHMSMTHGTNECAVFQNVIQKMIDSGNIQEEEPAAVMIEPSPVNHVVEMINVDPRAAAYARQKISIGCQDCGRVVDSLKEEVCRLGSANGGHLHQRKILSQQVEEEITIEVDGNLQTWVLQSRHVEHSGPASKSSDQHVDRLMPRQPIHERLGPRTSQGFGMGRFESRTVKYRLSWPYRSQGLSFGRSAQPFVLPMGSVKARMWYDSNLASKVAAKTGRKIYLRQKRELEQSSYGVHGRQVRVTKQWQNKKHDSMDVNMVYVLPKEYAARQAMAKMLEVKVDDPEKTVVPKVNLQLKEALVIWGANGPEVLKADAKLFMVQSNPAEAFYYEKDVGPCRLLGIDKYSKPMTATPMKNIGINEWKMLWQEIRRLYQYLAPKPQDVGPVTEEVFDDDK
ncbi:OLC1v1001179C1 [Oldenlandia corymbosa var. corymbosa]|uniref:OLC1v1001179C1 n=1 Tax=Oldenlandia corymbosa var. corymbosa TaxID=529605 RepID=A0AAV1D6C4_OLDCO|nr:OLC1v1001179C1 [Oldenlandia corymbosa var. corymbosa]